MLTVSRFKDYVQKLKTSSGLMDRPVLSFYVFRQCSHSFIFYAFSCDDPLPISSLFVSYCLLSCLSAVPKYMKIFFYVRSFYADYHCCREHAETHGR
jgi:hypothetical protein